MDFWSAALQDRPQLAILLPAALLLGLSLGSFYTALASRVLYFCYGPGRKRSNRWSLIFAKPSFCMQCDTRIQGVALTPVLGYFWLRGRCENCGARIGLYTLAGELFPGILFPLLLLAGWSFMGALFAILFAGHLYVSVATDSKFLLLDHENALFLALFAVCATLERTGFAWLLVQPYVITAGVAGGLFLLLFLLSRMRGLGFGDVTLVTILGLFFGFPWMLAVVNLGAALAIVYILLIQRNLRAPAPLGACLALAACVTLLAMGIYGL